MLCEYPEVYVAPTSRPKGLGAVKISELGVSGALAATVAALLCFAPAGNAQSTVVATPVALTSLVQASDGNYYGVTPPENVGQASMDCSTTAIYKLCGAIYQVTPAGVVNLLFTFPSGTGAPNGAAPNPLIIGPNGNLYGITASGGSTTGDSTCESLGCGVLFQITTGGAFQVIHNFTDAELGTNFDPSQSYYGAHSFGAPLLGSDGSFYEAARGYSGDSGAIYKISPSGDFQLLHMFSTASPGDGFEPSGLVQGTDGKFYGTTESNVNPYASYPGQNGTIFRMTSTGVLTTLAVFPADGTLGLNPGSLVEGPDGSFYGLTRGQQSVNIKPYPTVFRLTPAGQLQTIYTFTSATSGFIPDAPLIFGSDGNLYGMAPGGGNSTSCPNEGYAGCGTMFQITPAGVFTVIHTFVEGTGGQFPGGGVVGTNTDTLVQGSDGKIAVTTGTYSASSSSTTATGVVYSFDGGLAPPIQLSFTNADGSPISGSVYPGTPLTLNWKVPGAYSLSTSLCYASVQGNPTTAGTWSGMVTGTTDVAGFHGSASVTPTAKGAYTYVLTCGGTESGFVTLNASNSIQITTTSLPGATVSTAYSIALSGTGGKTPYTWGYSGTLPKGLSLDPAGILFGTPTQFGSYQVTIGVQDSSNPPLMAAATFPLTITSGLALSGPLNNATVGSAYTATLKATGGYGNYKFALVTGTLPDGLNLNTSTGVIYGTPTTAGKSTFTISLTDSESPAAQVTNSFTLSTVVTPLTVETGDFAECTVNVACPANFTATGGTPPYTWSIAPGTSFPPGLTLNPNGTLAGKPTQYDTGGVFPSTNEYELSVVVTDSATPPLQATGTDGLPVVSGLKLVPFTMPNATVGSLYQGPTPVATGGLPPYTWSVFPSDPVIKSEFGLDPKTGILTAPVPPTVAGTYTLTYQVTDAEGNPAATDMTVVSFTVAPLLVPTATSLSASTSLAGSGMSVTLTAHVTETGAAKPTGTVAFLSGSTPLGTVAVDATGTASLTTSFSTAGTYTLTAIYSGDANSAGSVSAPLVETVVTPGVSGALNPATLTVTAGNSGTLTITISSTGGYTGNVAFSCGSVPAHISCSFNPPSVVLSSSVTTATSVLTVSTGSSSAALTMPGGPPQQEAPVTWAALLGVVGLCLLRRRGKLGRLNGIGLLLLLSLGAISATTLLGCGAQSPDAAPGTYTIPITLQLAGGPAQVVNATVVVQ